MDYLSNGLESFCTALDQVKTPVLFCERFDEKSNIWNFASHKHDCIELLYFLYGNAEVKLEESSMSASFYDLVIYPSRMYHTEHLPFNQHQEIICVWVDIPGLEFPNVIRVQDKDSGIKWLLESLHAECKNAHPSLSLIEHYIKATMILIAKKYFTANVAEDPVSRVIQYMQDHMAEQISIDTLSDLIFVSKSYLNRLFKKHTGISPIEYLNMIRVEKAKFLLVSSDKTVDDISELIGYNSPKYFCRAFRNCTGMSPREFKTVGKRK